MPKNLDSKRVDLQDIAELQENFNLSFGYGDGSRSYYSHSYSNRESEFSLVVRGDIPEELKVNFDVIDDGEYQGYFFRAAIDDSKKISIKNKDVRTHKAAERELRSIYERKKLQDLQEQQDFKLDPKPSLPQSKLASVDLISEKIQAGKKVHFFTGAGLSVDAIPDWIGLMKAMGYDQKRDSELNLQDSLATIHNEQDLLQMMVQLHETHKNFFQGVPSKGHQIIGNISETTGCAILTDNRDILHQVSGFDAIHVCQIADFQTRPWDPVVTCNPQEIDALVVCGMGGDRRGFLKWLREKNPNVEIINLNLQNTLAGWQKVDYFIEGDVQKNLQDLEKLLQITKGGEYKSPSSSPENPESSPIFCGLTEQGVIS